jgi:hypothetical protein
MALAPPTELNREDATPPKPAGQASAKGLKLSVLRVFAVKFFPPSLAEMESFGVLA